MQYIEKWRETLVDPIKTNFPCGMKVLEILSYPHAGNDVFVCFAEFDKKKHLGVLKIERHCDANISHECRYIEKLKFSGIKVPDIISCGELKNSSYIFTKFHEGEKLSIILSNENSENNISTSSEYMIKFGENLSRIHSIDFMKEKAKERKFQKIMTEEQSENLGLSQVNSWLQVNKPKHKELCFTHGDHHYANILWHNKNIKCTLDWELCGIGWRELDMAWAIVLRPSQKFLKTKVEIDSFLKGYSKHNSYDKNQFEYCIILAYQYFYQIAKKSGDIEYEKFIIKEIKRITSITLR